MPSVADVEAFPHAAVSSAALASSASPAARERTLETYRWMLLARLLDEKLASLYRAGKINGGVYLGTGQEALSASLGVHLRKGDIFAPLIRDMAGRLAFGESVLDATRTYLGSRLGPMRGRDGNIHRGRPREGSLAMISHLGAMVSVVNGALFARRLKGELGDSIGAASIGDGGTSTGAFHEAVNQAAVERLPLVVVVANNQYAYSTPTSRQYGCHDLLDRAAGYGFHGHAVDGTDLRACLETLGNAVESARAGHGPQMIVANLLRLTGHGAHDDAAYMDPALRTAPVGRDCLKVAAEQLRAAGWADEADLEAIRAAAIDEVERAVAQTQREPGPDGAKEDWCALSTRALAEPAAVR